MARLNHRDSLPAGFFEAGPEDLKGLLGGPTLFHLKGTREPALFISVLLHGNEPAGFTAIQNILAKTAYGNGTLKLPRSLYLFIGNVDAAEVDLRHLEGQPDYNRIWPGAEGPKVPEAQILQQVTDEMKACGLFASIDVHSTTGMNPHFGCVNKLEVNALHLASFFSRTVVYFRMPKGTQSLCFSEFTTAVTVECGKVGDKTGVEHAEDYLWAALRLSDFPHHEVAAHDVNIYHTIGRMTMVPGATFSFANGPEKPNLADLHFVDHLDHFNFNELPVGTVFGRVSQENEPQVVVKNEAGADITADFFIVEGCQLKTRARVMPSMLTRDEAIIQNDCIGYVMERLPFAVDPGEG